MRDCIESVMESINREEMGTNFATVLIECWAVQKHFIFHAKEIDPAVVSQCALGLMKSFRTVRVSFSTFLVAYPER